MAAGFAGCGRIPNIRVQLGSEGGARLQNGAAMVVGDEPSAVLAARDILVAGGAAADAAVTLGLALTVTLPSQAGLGGGGACLVHDAGMRTTEVLDFRAPAAADDDGARLHVAVPATARGLFALHARYGALPWAQVVAPAETLARFDTRVSRAFAQDLAVEGGALAADTAALTAFMTPRRQLVQAGDTLVQLNLAGALARIRARGPGDFYTGPFARELEAGISAVGGAVTAADLARFVPRWMPAAAVSAGAQSVFTVPEEIAGNGIEGAGGSTGFIIADARGGVAVCVLAMGRSFGLGIMPAGGGFLLAPAPGAQGGGPASAPPRLLASMAVSRVTGALIDAEVRTRFVNKLACAAGENATPVCSAASDARGAGYALTVDPGDLR